MLAKAIFNLPYDERSKYRMRAFTLEKLPLPESFPQRLGPDIAKTELGQGNNKAKRSILEHQLKAFQAHATPVRIALIGGFGHNLGDSLIGLSALRSLQDVLDRSLPDYRIDVLLGPLASPAIQTWFNQISDKITIQTAPMNVTQLCGYDAYFEVADCFNHTLTERMTTIDAFLYAFGILPDQVPGSEKRNHYTYVNKQQSQQRIASWLEQVPKEATLCYIAHSASVPLRSMPVSFLQTLIQHIVQRYPDIWLVTDVPFLLRHTRVIPVQQNLASVDLLAALLEHVDGAITVDSFVWHLCDAVSCPAFCFSATLSQDRLAPYYPLGAVMNINRADQLAGWQKGKVDEADWKKMAPDYQIA